MLDAGEDPLYLARRVVRMAVEDIGLADPQALVICQRRQGRLRLPRHRPRASSRIAQAVIYRRDRAEIERRLHGLWRGHEARAKEAGSLMPPKHILNAPTKLMKAGRLRRGLRLRPRRRGGLLRPGLLPGRAGPADVLRPARARLRARDQEAARLLGEAAQGKGWGVMLRTVSLGGLRAGRRNAYRPRARRSNSSAVGR